MEEFKNFITDNFAGFCVKLAVTLLILVAGLWLAHITVKLVKRGKLLKKLDPSVKGFLDSALSLVLKLTVIVTAVAYAGVPISSIIALIGSLGVTIGLALQGGLSNVAGGLLLLINKPFKVGDYIKVGEFDGIVEEITIYYTVIKTFDAKVVSVPNGTVSGSAIVNNFTGETRRADLTFSAAYSSDIDLVKRVLLDTASANARVLKDPEPKALLSEHAESSLKFTLRVWVKVADFWDVQFELKEEVKKAFDAAGIEIPFPQLDVHNK